MFKPLNMQRLALHVLREDAALAALLLADGGVFNPETSQVDPETMPELPSERYRELYRSARARLDKVLAHCKTLQEFRPPAALRQVSEQELSELDEWLRTVWAECSKCQEGLRRIEEEQKHIQQLQHSLENFVSLDIDLGLLAGPKRFVDVHVGTVPSQNVARLEAAVGLAGYLTQPFRDGDDVTQLVVAGPAGKEAEVRAVLQSADWRPMEIPPELHDRPEKVRRDLEARLEQTVTETDLQCRLIENTQKEFNDKLIVARERLAMAAPYADLGESLRGRGGLVLITGWAPTRDVDRLRARLAERLGAHFVLTVRDPLPEERASVPSVARYPRWIRPFGTLVRTYGVPRYGEFDPTWLFTVTYILMFGMMFGDIGHGAVIVAIGIGLRRILKNFAFFVAAIGLSSMAFGWLYGSIFGYEHVIAPMWMSPLSDPILMLTLAMYWGIGFIVLATVLTIYNRLNEGLIGEAMLDSKGLAGLLFYLGLLFAAYRGIQSGSLGALEWGAALAPFAIVLGYKWHHYHAGTGERILVVFIEGFETVTSYLSATLSFLRVAAFSLNHVALAIAVFTLAGMMDTAGHWITVVLGNVFILVLEGGIVAIQVLRLEYYEGFSRFFRGDGREFRPLVLGAGARPS